MRSTEGASAQASRSPRTATPRWSAGQATTSASARRGSFTRSGTVWTQQGPKLTAKAGEEVGTGEFGESVALSTDGNTALVGGPGEDLGFSHRYGAAWAFTRSGSTWTQQGEKLQGPSGEIEGGEFGASVALASEGNTALIGGPTDNKGVGAAWAYTRSGSTWTQQGEKLTAKAGEEIGAGEFGASVALSSATGNTALIGADADNSAVGAAWAFTRSGSTWTQQGGKLTATSGEIGEGEFGQSVALSSEGNTALVGGPGDNEHVGAAWILTRAGSTWTQQEKLTGGGGSGISNFGFSVALSSEGNTALAGGPYRQPRRRRDVGVREHRPDGRHQSGVAGRPDHGDAERDREPRTAGRSANANSNTAPRSPTDPPRRAPRCRGRGTARSRCPRRSRASRRTPPTTSGSPRPTRAARAKARRNAQNAAERPDGRDHSGVGAHPDHGDAERDREPQRRRSQRMQIRIRHHGCLRIHRVVRLAAGVGTSPVAVSAAVTGLTANTTYHFRISATNPGGTSKGSDQTLKTLPNAPTVVTTAASALTQTTATLNATVNPNGGEVSECKFEYGTTEAYGSTASCASLPGSGTSPVAVSAAVTGLTANTTYHFRISATNAGGTSKGSDQTLKTLPNAPTVVTTAASSLTQTTATLNATVNPNGGEVSECKFEYGTTIAYGSTASCASLPGSGTSPVAVSAAVTGLTANTTYHFRISATNPGGTSKGSDQTLKTLPNAPTVVTTSGVGGHPDHGDAERDREPQRR